MEPKPSKAKKRFKFIFTTLVIIFCLLYFASSTGYYEKKISSKTALTKDAIKAFEEDVANGKNVDIKDYIEVHDDDYKSLSSKIGYTISNSIDTILNDGVGYIIKLLKALFS